MQKRQTSSSTEKKKQIPVQGSSSGNGSSEKGENRETKSGKTLEDLLEEGLKDIYSAEKQLVDALPDMAKAADNEDLEDVIKGHLEETKKQVERLEKIFDRLQIDKDEVETCKAMEGLIEEGKKVMEEFESGPVRDSALVIAAQKIEHYEIASYGSLCELADVLGYHKTHDLLGRTLEEEEMADSDLSDIAMEINDEALEMSEEAMEY